MSDRYNAADPTHVKGRGRQTARRDGLFRVALKESLASAATRLVFAELLERSGLYATSGDEGKRAFGIELRDWLEAADADAFEQMEREHRARRRSEARERDAVESTVTTEDADTP